ncbi:MFS transporter [Nakamurella sp. YIM 132087]|uniref:MFS transporter n=2 Tax=Nakamurella alba TaxID=2665158 RepID=A0A7K1FTR4_9ACTN|nr:MFS transporter [Nakamurella alba]
MGQVVSNTGTWMQRIAQDWLVLQLTNSPLAVGVTTALQFVPTAVLGLWGGLIADRFPKHRLLLLTQSFMCALAVVLAALTLTGVVEVWHVYLIAFLLGMATVVDTPTRQTFVNEMVPRRLVPNAVSLNTGNFQLARMIGPAVAGLLISAVGTGWAFALNALSFAAVLTGLAMIRPADLVPMPRAARGRGQLREGLRYVRNTPELLWPTVLIFFIGTFGYNFPIILSAYAKDVFDGGADLYGWLNAAMAFGSVVGALLAARRTTTSLRTLLLWGAGFGAVLAVLGLTPWLPVYFAVLVATGFVSVGLNTMANATVQLSTAPELRGRVMSIYMLVFLGSTPIGSLIVGAITEHWGAPPALVLSGSICLLAAIAVLVLARRQQRRRDRSGVAAGAAADATGEVLATVRSR